MRAKAILADSKAAVFHAIKRATLSEKVAEQVRQAIISGQIPEGSAVGEIQLAEQLHVSRVPVREALVELEHDGIIIFDQRGRSQVRSFSASDVDEIVSLRLTLEVMSARFAARNLTPEDAAALQRNLKALENERDVLCMSRLDVEFHDLIMNAARHQRLLVCWRTVRAQFELLLAKAHRWQQQHDIPVNDHALRGHRPILQALLRRDPDLAAQEMLKHVREWGEWMPVITHPNHPSSPCNPSFKSPST